MKKKTQNNNSTFRSYCCNAKVKTNLNLKKLENFGCTMYYICTKCHEACDVYLKERKMWAINPKTRIVPNKKKDRLFTDKECEEFRMNEDF